MIEGWNLITIAFLVAVIILVVSIIGYVYVTYFKDRSISNVINFGGSSQTNNKIIDDSEFFGDQDLSEINRIELR